MLTKIYPVGNKKIELIQGSITNYVADAVVCPANGDLEMLAVPGGIQYAILKDGGAGIFEEASRVAEKYEREHGPSFDGGIKGRVPIFSAHVTSGGSLPVRYVIHSVAVDHSPTGGVFCDKKIIEMSVKNVLCKCDELGIESVGFPTLGTGGYAVPIEDSALSIATTSAKHLKTNTPLERVGLVIYSGDNYSIVKEVLDSKLR